METVFKLKTAELDKHFIDSIKNLFKDSEIEISIRPVIDETEFLLSNPVNKKLLLEAINEIKKNKNLIRFTGIEFDELSEKLLSAWNTISLLLPKHLIPIKSGLLMIK
jgi:antitoxin YefM